MLPALQKHDKVLQVTTIHKVAIKKRNPLWKPCKSLYGNIRK